MLVRPLPFLSLSLPTFFFLDSHHKLSLSNFVVSHSRYPPTRCAVWTCYIWDYDGSVSKVTALRNGRPKNRASVLGKDKRFFSHPNRHGGGHPASIQWLPETLLAGGKAAGAWSWPPYSVPWISGALTPLPHMLSRCTQGLITFQTARKCSNNIRTLTVDTEDIFDILSGRLR